MQESLSSGFVNIKCSDQSGHPVRIFKVVSVAEQAGLGITWSETPKTDFPVSQLI